MTDTSPAGPRTHVGDGHGPEQLTTEKNRIHIGDRDHEVRPRHQHPRDHQIIEAVSAKRRTETRKRTRPGGPTR